MQDRSCTATMCTLVNTAELHVPKLVFASSPAQSHDRPGHPECAARGTAILDALQAAELTVEALPGQARHTMTDNRWLRMHLVQGSHCGLHIQ